MNRRLTLLFGLSAIGFLSSFLPSPNAADKAPSGTSANAVNGIKLSDTKIGFAVPATGSNTSNGGTIFAQGGLSLLAPIKGGPTNSSGIILTDQAINPIVPAPF
jgi:hypothetical protein